MLLANYVQEKKTSRAYGRKSSVLLKSITRTHLALHFFTRGLGMSCSLNSLSATHVKPKTLSECQNPNSAALNVPGKSHLRKADLAKSKSCYIQVNVRPMMHPGGGEEEETVPVSDHPWWIPVPRGNPCI